MHLPLPKEALPVRPALASPQMRAGPVDQAVHEPRAWQEQSKRKGCLHVAKLLAVVFHTLVIWGHSRCPDTLPPQGPPVHMEPVPRLGASFQVIVYMEMSWT